VNGVMLRGWSPALLAATVIFAALLLQPAGILTTYDIERMHQCYKHDFRSAVLGGEWPWWNPYTALGRPFFADIETALLYPPTWLVLPLGVEVGILAIVWLHLVLAIEGTRRLGDRLVLSSGFALIAGIAFTLSGALLSRIQSGQLHLFCVVCLWPWIWAAALQMQDSPGRRTLVQFAGWLAVAFLAGSPQILWCGLVPLPFLLASRSDSLRNLVRTLVSLGAATTLAGALVAVQLLPFIELLQQGNRSLSDPSFAIRHGQAASDWLTLILPPGPWLPTLVEFNVHVGALLVAAAAAAIVTGFRHRTVIGLSAAAVVSGLLAAGGKTPLLPFLAEYLPGFSGLRYPSRYALTLALAIPLLAGWWLTQQARRQVIRPPWIGVGLTLHAALMLTALFIQGTLYRAPATPRYEAQIRTDLREANLPTDRAPARAALPSSLLRANAGAQADLSTLAGFNNPWLARTWGTIHILTDEPPSDFHRTDVPNRIIDKLQRHASHFSLALTRKEPSGEVLYSRPAGPRVYISEAARTVSTWELAAAMIRDGHDPVRQPLVEQELTLPHESESGTNHAEITHFSRNRVVVTTHSGAQGLLVLGEAWYPGWHASVGDVPVEVIPANGWMRAIVLPNGKHTIEFKYRPNGLATGTAISILTLAVGMLAWGRSSRSQG